MKPYSLLNNVIFLDIETTGIDPYSDKIIEIGAIKIKEGKVTEFSTLVNPKRQVPLNILDLCKDLSLEEVKQARPIEEVMKELLIFIEDLPLICHNANFERSFLKISNEFLDSMELAAILYPELSEFNLQYLIKKFLPNSREESHRGLSDSKDTLEVLNYMLSSFYIENGYALPMSILELEKWNWYKYLTSLKIEEVNCFIMDKLKDNVKSKAQPALSFALKDYEKLFKNQDIWQRRGDSYTERPQQIEASKYIRQGLQQGNITIMEAPTGLGKSLAYILPASIYTYLNRGSEEDKVIISTNTKGLQSQLVEKDIPNLLDTLNLSDEVNYTLIKGKVNYFCIDRFMEIEYPKDMNTLLGYTYIRRYIREKGLGDIEHINYGIKKAFNLEDLIPQSNCDSDLCDVNTCRFKEECFYAGKVRELKEAQLVVVNHSLLLKWPYKAILPIKNIVIDEAHNLSKEAYDAFENDLMSEHLATYLDEIYNKEAKKGYLLYLLKKSNIKTLPIEDIERNLKICFKTINRVGESLERYIRKFNISTEYNVKEQLIIDDYQHREICFTLKELKENMNTLNLYLEKAVNTLKDISSLEGDKRLKMLGEKVEGINGYTSLIDDMIEQKKKDYCYYFEVDKNLRWWKISSIPLDVSSIFYDKILSEIKSCSFISATLATDIGYGRFRNTLGIDIAKSQNKKIVEVQPIKPVFNYSKRSAIYAPDILCGEASENFVSKMKEFVLALIKEIDGNILILFTSKKRLNSFRKEASGELNALGVRLIDSKRDIEKLKARDHRYVFIGSKGFFEGVDIPGDAMNTVILDKMPNINSREPFFKALIENELVKGKSYWQAYENINFPIVSIDLKQIYGRLIRTEYDYGALFVLDKFNNQESKNTTVKKVEKLLYGVPIIRSNLTSTFRDLRIRTLRWKIMNLFKILGEVKEDLKSEVKKRKRGNLFEATTNIEKLINDYLKQEYEKRKLYWDINIKLNNIVKIEINKQEVELGVNKEKISKYFKDIMRK